MASIFTFDPDPPRVSSPWSSMVNSQHRSSPQPEIRVVDSSSDLQVPKELFGQQVDTIDGIMPSRLEAEPQDGPTEYKLHLLLRPRRSLSYISTARHMSGSRPRSSPSTPRNVSESSTGLSTPLSQVAASRQHRLEQLTTQLLWRLQQSSPYHSSSANNIILPSLPDATSELQAPQNPAKLLPGLEDSKGALYEVGVSDDGTFVGLTEDEMNESLNNLGAMAASLGCSVNILRMVPVGECEWHEDDDDDLFGVSSQLKQGKLYVAEAYIKPVLHSHDALAAKDKQHNGRTDPHSAVTNDTSEASTDDGPVTRQRNVEQLRVSLTGATTCGKSSLLGTLSTSTLDNGRGKSRLSLLKHRHEIASGMTSSVAQELIGYQDLALDTPEDHQTRVVNYAAGNVSSWNDIHASAEPGRLAFLSDCAGHPRYRRTTVRGLVGWAPHWTFLCIAANDVVDIGSDNGREAAEGDGIDFSGATAHISMAHLELCLRLELPLVVLITKLDLASKTSIRQVLTTLLTSLKAAGRKPIVLSNDSSPVTEKDLQIIGEADAAEVTRLTTTIKHDDFATVPILFTSAVKGAGIGKLHALLRHLPIPHVLSQDLTYPDHAQCTAASKVLFHVDDSFSLSMQDFTSDSVGGMTGNVGCIISGHLANGIVSIGDELSLGPFSTIVNNDSEDSNPTTRSNPNDPFLSPRSFSDALARATTFSRNRAILPEDEWRQVRVVSIRNLRLPTSHLQADQAGTLGIVAVDDTLTTQSFAVRKGMVLLDGDTTAAHTVTGSFDVAESSSIVVGTLVVIYCASVRASAKVIAIALQENAPPPSTGSDQSFGREAEDKFGFGLDEELEQRRKRGGESILVTFQFLTYREWLEIGSRILVMPGGGYSGKGRGAKGFMEGFVGRVVERFR